MAAKTKNYSELLLLAAEIVKKEDKKLLDELRKL
jgi:hypothetical protein